MIKQSTNRATRSWLIKSLVAALAGGSVATSCDTRVRQAVVAGAKDYLFSQLDPANIIQLFEPSDE